MITPEEISKQLGNFNDEDRVALEAMSNEIKTISESKEISMELVKKLENAVDELSILYRKYNSRLIALLKHGCKFT